jgi:hypothetical protein
MRKENRRCPFEGMRWADDASHTGKYSLQKMESHRIYITKLGLRSGPWQAVVV